MNDRSARRAASLVVLTLAPGLALAQWVNVAPNHITNTNPGSVGVGVTSDASMFGKLSVEGAGSGGIGVWARSDAFGGAGVYGESRASAGTGVLGYGGLGGFGQSIGVWGIADSPSGVAVAGNARAGFGTTIALFGQVNSADGYAGYFIGGRNYFQNRVGIGTNNPRAELQIGPDPGNAVRTWMSNGVLIGADSDAMYVGLKDEGANRDDPVIAWGDDTAESLRFIFAQADGPANGVELMRLTAQGGLAINHTTPQARLDARGGGEVIRGETTGTNNQAAIWGVAGNAGAYAGYFNGRVGIIGNLTVQGTFSATGSKAFAIDHPLDPANKILKHYCVESPEPMNVYRGVVTLDPGGAATIELPDYFDAINRDPTYTLTPVGGPMPGLHVSREAEGNSFAIAGGVPGLRVSWRVEASRHDAHIRRYGAPTVVEKAPHERGMFLAPELWGAGAAKGLGVKPGPAE
jgi:hypothetical protein